MIIIMEKGATEEQIEAVIEKLIGLDFNVHRSTGEVHTVLGAVGPSELVDPDEFKVMPGVMECHRVMTPYQRSGRAAKEGRRIACPPGGEDAALAAAFLREYRRCGRVQDAERTEKALRKGMDREYFLERVSRVNRALREALGGVRSQPYEISRAGRRAEAEYVLGVQAGSIRFIGE